MSDVLVCTTPIRPVPTDFPPFGSMAVIQHLRRDGHDPFFLDIDHLRPSWDDVARTLERERPKVIGISAVVSTAYAYTRDFTRVARSVLPETTVVVGGNLAASAEVLLRRAGVDVCVAGDGEVPFAELVRWSLAGGDRRRLASIPGLVFLDEADEVRFTRYADAIAAHDLSDPDYTILERFSRIDWFIRDPVADPDVSINRHFVSDPRFDEPHRRGKRAGTVVTAKGCVARCTFCHRWERGFRQLPVAKIVRRIRDLVERYDVGFVQFGDENFGSDPRALDALLPALRELDILWGVGGMRARTTTPGLLRRMREAGCVAVYFGIESGSQRILDVMEKNTRVERNREALAWTREAGLHTTVQLVLGMPGEDPASIAETTAFVREATAAFPEPPAERLSINYAQALPGTPLYEYARRVGLLGATPEDEERYLLRISDTDAADDATTLNFTGRPFLELATWRGRMILDATQHWYAHGVGRARPTPVLGLGRVALLAASRLVARAVARARGATTPPAPRPDWAGYFNIRASLFHGRLTPAAYRMRGVLLFGWALWHALTVFGARRTVTLIGEWLAFHLAPKRRRARGPAGSLRTLVRTLTPPPVTPSERSMDPLRAGR
ncbi:MAG: B12-binding domain-containing radical SAM protein [Candidatus Rokubacteria bacterium]|nr:B12-binding domain-containing radical SAM protein [Candidatus Rokubacteria bacterium]